MFPWKPPNFVILPAAHKQGLPGYDWILIMWSWPRLFHDMHGARVLQSTPDNSNLQGKSKKVRVIASSSYRELEKIAESKAKNSFYCTVNILITFNNKPGAGRQRPTVDKQTNPLAPLATLTRLILVTRHMHTMRSVNGSTAVWTTGRPHNLFV